MQRMSQEVRRFLRHAASFVVIALMLYAGLYAASEWLVCRHADRNRFFMIKTAPHARYDAVILGASHAAVFGYRDMNIRLEAMTSSKIINLAVVGGGVAVNRLLLEYFLARHDTTTVVYVLDSFAFYSPEWNENRFEDARLFARAPFDPVLARLLLESSASLSVVLDYIAGFSKINNNDRFAPDTPADEGPRFDRAYRAVPQIDRQRVEYLYPDAMDDRVRATRDHYFGELVELIGRLRERGIRLIVVRPPIPERYRRLLPGEDEFDAALRALLDSHRVELHDWSRVSNDDTLFFDTDHLNQRGLLQLFEHHLTPTLRPGWLPAQGMAR